MMQSGGSATTFVLVMLVYALLISLPFVPGIEIGIGVVIMMGPQTAPWVWLATFGGLTLAFFAGYMLSHDRLYQFFADFRMRRACLLIQRFADVPQANRLDHLRQNLPKWLRPLATSHRYMAMGLLFNLPGNALLGGGGGIAVIAGITRIFTPWVTVLAIGISTLPFPLVVWFWGPDVITGVMEWFGTSHK